MPRKTALKRRNLNEEIDVRVFKDIQIRFPGDVYILAVWLAMSDRAKSTPTCHAHTTLHGLARYFESLHGSSFSNPLTSEDVMDKFRTHGITGNPLLRLDATAELSFPMSITVHSAIRMVAPTAKNAEQGDAHQAHDRLS